MAIEPGTASIINQVGGTLYDQLTMGQQMDNQIELMDLQQANNLELQKQQFGNQMSLNQQGHNLQYDMWNKTNFGAQMEHLKKAGLNPALMYGKGGAGGQTGSQGGGSATGGSAGLGMAPKAPGTELYGAQANLMNEQARLAKIEGDKKSGVDTDKINSEILKLDAETQKAIQEKTNLKSQDAIMQFQKEITKAERDRTRKGTLKGDLLGNVLELYGLDPVNNTWDRMQLKTMLNVWFGAKIGSDIMNIVTKGKFGALSGNSEVNLPKGHYHRGKGPVYTGTPSKGLFGGGYKGLTMLSK